MNARTLLLAAALAGASASAADPTPGAALDLIARRRHGGRARS
jgi:hypothetical protein